MSKFIKAVSDTVFDMINAVYREKPLLELYKAARLSCSKSGTGIHFALFNLAE